MKRQVVAGLAGLLLAMFAGSALGGVQYTVTDLGTLGGPTSHAYDINNRGQIIGSADTTESFGGFSYFQRGFLWQKGVPTRDLGVCSGPTGSFRCSYARAINENGQVTGNADYFGGYSSPFSWQDGSGMQNIGGGPYNWAYGINNSGQIVGSASTASGAYYAFCWKKETGMQDIGVGKGGGQAINDNGQIVGATYDQDGVRYAFSWQNDTGIQNLGTGANSCAYSVNLAGQVVGIYGDAPSDRAFFWSSDTGRQDLGGTGSIAYHINNRGQIVGKTGAVAYLWQDGVGKDLNSLIAPNSGWTLYEANSINDLGQIVGYGRNPSGQYHAFLLDPVPEPSTLVLLGMAAVALLSCTRKGLRLSRLSR